MRLKDNNEDWGLSITDNAKLARVRQRDRDRKRAQRAILKMRAPPLVPDYPQETHSVFRLKAQDIQCLGILAYRKYIPNRVALGLPMTAKGEGDWVSLPYVSILDSKMVQREASR